MTARRRRLIAGLGTLVAALLLALFFYMLGLSLADPEAVRALHSRPYLGAFALWTLPLAALLAWVGGRWSGGRAWSGLVAALVGLAIGAAYAYAMLFVTNMALMSFHFPVLWTWAMAAALALIVAWTPATAAGRLLSTLPIIAAIAWIVIDYRVSARPSTLMIAYFRPGTSTAERAEFDRTVLGNGLPGVIVSGSDPTRSMLRFSPHASARQRADAERGLRASSLVARVEWFNGAQTESIDAAQSAAIAADIRPQPRDAIILWYRPGTTRAQQDTLEHALVDVPYAAEEVKAVARAGIRFERERSTSDTTITVVRFDPNIDDLWRGRLELQARESPLVARTAWAAADEKPYR
jgi:hypothetical protein